MFAMPFNHKRKDALTRRVNMPTLGRNIAVIAMMAALSAAHSFADEPTPPAPPHISHPAGQINALSIQAGSTDETSVGAVTTPHATLPGPDSRLQLVVTARYTSGEVRDCTGSVSYVAAPAGIIKVNADGSVVPLADGSATVTISNQTHQTASATITVEGFSNPPPVNFPNQVVPIFTKLGCNSGACHGKSSGQNGFRLSLLGFEPAKDYRFLVEESRGRRVFPAAPNQSLLLSKSINMVAHGGGERMKKDSPEYRTLYRWISQGMPYGRDTDPTLANVTVFPSARTLSGDGDQQILVVAHYSDGSSEDITRSARYDVNDKDLATVSDTGDVKMTGRPGDVAVMVRYQGQVGVFRATVPVGAPVDHLPVAKNFVDEMAFAKFTSLGLPPSGVCNDATFLRRVTLDIAGRLPTAAEAREFLADSGPAKRDQCIDRLLASEDYADLFAEKWCAILKNHRDKETYQRDDYLFHEWVRQSMLDNKPYDQFVRELITATGDAAQTPAVAWYRQVKEPTELVEDTAQLFLGVRIGCAKCHHHPFEKWSQQDYYGMAAFFSQVGRKDGQASDEIRIYHKRGEAVAHNPNGGAAVKPTGLGSKPTELTVDEDPRVALADWMTNPKNPFFAKSAVNRYWKHFFGRGIVDPEDDMRETNPPTNPRLLNALAEHFVASHFDLKDLVKAICQSQLYQLSSEPNEYNDRDRQSYSHFYPRRLPAEIMLDAVDQMSGTKSTFKGTQVGSRAVQIPDMGGVDSNFLQVFGRPAGTSACECERNGETSLAQTLLLLNSGDIYDKLGTGCAVKLAGVDAKRTDREKIVDLYYGAFSRPPTDKELSAAFEYIDRSRELDAKTPDKLQADRKAAYEDLLWALINTKEFLFNH